MQNSILWQFENHEDILISNITELFDSYAIKMHFMHMLSIYKPKKS